MSTASRLEDSGYSSSEALPLSLKEAEDLCALSGRTVKLLHDALLNPQTPEALIHAITSTEHLLIHNNDYRQIKEKGRELKTVHQHKLLNDALIDSLPVTTSSDKQRALDALSIDLPLMDTRTPSVCTLELILADDKQYDRLQRAYKILAYSASQGDGQLLDKTREIALKILSTSIRDPFQMAVHKQRLGEGSYGYVETVEVDSQLYAAKRPHEGCYDPLLIDTECHALMTLKHRNIIEGVHADFPDIYMQLLHGSTLQEIETPMSSEQSLNVVTQLASAVYYMHQQGYLHGDIHTNNIFLTDDGTVKLFDLGSVCTIKAPSDTSSYSADDELHSPTRDIQAFGTTIQSLLKRKILTDTAKSLLKTLAEKCMKTKSFTMMDVISSLPEATGR